MNDADIIKALGFCFAVGDCDACMYADKPCQNLMADALDLINRQKSEIERLEHHTKLHDEIIAEAIKEFTERLKKSAFCCDVSFGYGKEHYTEAVAVVEIDNLVKGMTEGKK